jgi:hypothetical protein
VVTGVSRTIAPGHALTGRSIGRVGYAVAPGRVVVGRTSENRPVLLPLFGPRPLRVAFVGGLWAANIVVLRCLGHGATVEVDAIDTVDRPAAGTLAPLRWWLSLDQTAGGTGDRVRPVDPGRPEPPATAVRPVLRIHDTGSGGAVRTPAAGPWRTELALLPRLTPAAVGAQPLLVQRLTQPEIALIAQATGPGNTALPLLGKLDNEMVAVVDNRSVEFVWLTPTPLERRLFG